MSLATFVLQKTRLMSLNTLRQSTTGGAKIPQPVARMPHGHFAPK